MRVSRLPPAMPRCEVCGREFVRDEEILRHARTAHPAVADAPSGSTGGYGCKRCGRSFSSERPLAVHAREAHGDPA
jgi:uncharacterized C2H2 Zn-finger protein